MRLDRNYKIKHHEYLEELTLLELLDEALSVCSCTTGSREEVWKDEYTKWYCGEQVQELQKVAQIKLAFERGISKQLRIILNEQNKVLEEVDRKLSSMGAWSGAFNLYELVEKIRALRTRGGNGWPTH